MEGLPDMRFDSTGRNSHHLGDLFMAHIMKITKKKGFAALGRKFIGRGFDKFTDILIGNLFPYLVGIRFLGPESHTSFGNTHAGLIFSDNHLVFEVVQAGILQTFV